MKNLKVQRVEQAILKWFDKYDDLAMSTDKGTIRLRTIKNLSKALDDSLHAKFFGVCATAKQRGYAIVFVRNKQVIDILMVKISTRQSMLCEGKDFVDSLKSEATANDIANSLADGFQVSVAM